MNMDVTSAAHALGRGRGILLRSGVIWYTAAPRPEDVRGADFETLKLIPRWGGATCVPYWVPEHCVRVARLLMSWGQPTTVVRHGLVHDLHESVPPYDFPGPVLLDDSEEAAALRAMERRARDAFRTALGEPLEFEPVVHHADMVLLATEAAQLMPAAPEHFRNLPAPLTERIKPMSMDEAWRAWCETFDALGGRWPA